MSDRSRQSEKDEESRLLRAKGVEAKTEKEGEETDRGPDRDRAEITDATGTDIAIEAERIAIDEGTGAGRGVATGTGGEMIDADCSGTFSS